MNEHAQTFRRLHQGPELLLIANAWDAGSARLIEHLGAKAIATTSAGMAWALGYADGERLPVEALLHSVRAIARVVRVPLSVDLERGFSDDPEVVARTVVTLAEAGVVGVNLEDGTESPGLLIAKLERTKQALVARGLDVFLNARTDTFLRALGADDTRLAETITRGRRYVEAGADGLFVPRLAEPAAIKAVTAALTLPVNLLAGPHLPSGSELTALGVKRLSLGSLLAAHALRQTAELARGFLHDGRSAPLDGAIPYAELNALFPD
jgi:2-methylisocitrate lyase-like PEP mutase family enzyme